MRARRIATAVFATVFAVAGLAACSDDEGADNTKTEPKALADQAIAAMDKLEFVQGDGTGTDEDGKAVNASLCADMKTKAVKGKLLICHGALDSFIPEDTIQKVRKALEDGKVDYQMIYYGGAYHSFTVPAADKAGVKGLAYHPAADRRSWQDMQQLFREVFVTKK